MSSDNSNVDCVCLKIQSHFLHVFYSVLLFTLKTKIIIYNILIEVTRPNQNSFSIIIDCVHRTLYNQYLFNTQTAFIHEGFCCTDSFAFIPFHFEILSMGAIALGFKGILAICSEI